MGTGYLLPYQLRAKGFIQGHLEQSKDGQVILRTKQGVFPVKVEGEAVPLGEEVVFRLLREEPGLVVLSPYRLETLEEALPFYKELFAGEEDLGRRLLLAAVQESLPLTREVFFNLKKGLFTAEKEWGVKIHPRVVAFLQARALPLTPRTLLWALYILFPSVQKVMWQRTGEQPPILPFLDKRPVDKGADAAEKNNTAVATKDELLEVVFREAGTFLRHQAQHDPGLPHFLFYFFPTPQKEIRWAGRGFAPLDQTSDDEGNEGRAPNRRRYAFCLAYQSAVFGKLEIIGVNNQFGLKLKVVADGSVLSPNHFAGLKAYLEEKGWPVQLVEFEEYQGEEAAPFQPLRIDGWL
jgi:hypothetical protein